jgi:hypothetical protein
LVSLAGIGVGLFNSLSCCVKSALRTFAAKRLNWLRAGLFRHSLQPRIFHHFGEPSNILGGADAIEFAVLENTAAIDENDFFVI